MSIDKKLISELRAKHKHIYKTTYGSTDYVWRGFTIGEYEALTTNPSSEKEEYFVSQIILHPEGVDIDKLPAGFVNAILNEAFEVSQFNNPKTANELIDKKRTQASLVIPMMKAFIISAQPSIDRAYLSGLTFEEFVDELVLSEKILEIQSNVTNPTVESLTFSIPDPEKIAEEEANRDPIKERLLAALEGVQPPI